MTFALRTTSLPPRSSLEGKKWSKTRSKGEEQQRSGSPANQTAAGTLTTSSTSTPSSVLVTSTATAISRDLSDLSGSYVNYSTSGGTTPKSSSGNASSGGRSEKSAGRPWSKARILSPREPHHPQPPNDCDDSVRVTRIRQPHHDFSEEWALMANRRHPSKDGDNDDDGRQPHHAPLDQELTNVELTLDIKKRISVDDDTSTSRSSAADMDRSRIPLVVLLMDPSRKVFELMRLWIDFEEDTARDVLYAVQRSLADKSEWKQDYDGLFQVRNNSFSQLIHILNISKYDFQPYELCVAKPWSMSAKSTVRYAGGLLEYLKTAGILRYYSRSDTVFCNSRGMPLPAMNGDDTAATSVLILSKEAKSRIYVPGAIQKHRHAHQFLAFAPPFGSSPKHPRVDVLSKMRQDKNEADNGSGRSASQVEGKGVITVEQASEWKEAGRNKDLPTEIKARGARERSFETSLGHASYAPSSCVSEPEGIEISRVSTLNAEQPSPHGWRKAILLLGCACQKNTREKEKNVVIFETADHAESGNHAAAAGVETMSIGRGFDDAASRAGDVSVISESVPLLLDCGKNSDLKWSML